MNEWITDRYPEPYKDILMFDLLKGKILGFYDIRRDTFINNNGSEVYDVAGWCYLPKDLKTDKTLKQSLNSYIPKVSVVKIET